MKKYLIFLLIAPFVFSSSCKKDDLGISRKMTGSLNGEKWEAKGDFTYNLPCDIGLDIGFEVYNSTGELREALRLHKIPFEKGNYTLSKTSVRLKDGLIGAVYRTFSHDGDVIDNRYRLYEPTENTVKITEANPDKKIIKGEVNATFLVDPHDVEDTDIDTIRIENGMFEVTLRG